LTSPTISGGTVDNAAIGGTTPSTGVFTTVQANTSLILEDPGAGNETITIQAPTIGMGGTYTLTLPTNDGDVNQALTTDGAGVLSWSTVATLSAGADDRMARYDGTNAIQAATSITVDDTDNIAGVATITVDTSVIFNEDTNNLTVLAADQTAAARNATIPNLTAGNDTFVFETHAATLANKTLILPQINDSAGGQKYVFAVSDLTADRTVTLPLLTGADTFVFESHSQTLANKTLTLPQINDSAGGQKYVFAVSDLTADRTVTLPLLTGADTFVFESHSQTLANKTLTLPQINDSAGGQKYVFAVSDLTADRTVTLPLLTGADTFVFEGHSQTLTNKTLTSPTISGGTVDNAAIGGTTPSTGVFTTVQANTSLILEDPGAGNETITIQAPTIGMGGTYTLTLPTNDGTSDQVFRTDGSGITSWQYRGWRAPVRAATTGAQTLATDFEPSDTIEGVSLAEGNRVLIKNQADALENGIYVVNAMGAPDRAADYATASNVASTFVVVQEGTTNADTMWVCTNNAFPDDEVDTDDLTFAQIGGAAGGGDVSGGSSSVDRELVLYNGTGGKTIQASTNAITVSDTADMTFPSEGSIIMTETGVGSNTVTIVAPSAIGTPFTLTLPADDGAANEVLSTDGSGVTSWVPAVGKKTMWIPAAAMISTVTNGAALQQIATTSNAINYKVYDFDTTTQEHVCFDVAFPKSWNLGTVTFQVFFQTSTIPAQSVVWKLQGVAISNDDPLDATYGTAGTITISNLSAAVNAATDLIVAGESNDITIGGTPAENDLVAFRLFRDVATDTYANDARLRGIKIFYTVSTLTDD
jgi:hypothetical protein